MEQIEKQAAELNRHFETLMIHLVQKQGLWSDEIHELNKQEANLIYILGERGASIMRELAENLRLHVSTTTGIVDKLIEKDLVSRERSEEDRRIVKVSLTTKGEKAYAAEAEKRRQMSLMVLTSLNGEERETFLKLFSKVAEKLEESNSIE